MTDLPAIPPSTRAPSPITWLRNLRDYVSGKPDAQASPAVKAVAERFSEMEKRMMKSPAGIVAVAVHEDGEEFHERLQEASRAYRRLRRTDRTGGEIAGLVRECEVAIDLAISEHERLSAICIRERLQAESLPDSGGSSPGPGDPPSSWPWPGRRFRLPRPRLATIVFCALGILLGFVLPEAQAINVDRSARGGNVATVDGEAISRKALDHWVKVAAAASAAQDPGTGAVAPDPPRFRKCISARRKAAAGRAGNRGEAPLRRRCARDYEALKSQVMYFLIRSEWLEHQAREMAVAVSDSEVRDEFVSARRRAFPNLKEYAKFLRDSGQTEADMLFRQRSQLIEQRVTERVNKAAGDASRAEIDSYYEKNRAQYVLPARRDLYVVLTRDKATAGKARKALEGGQSWAEVARRYSIDQASKRNGGKLPAVTEGTQEAAFDRAIFKAPEGEVRGPVRTRRGYYVFEVIRGTEGRTRGIEEVEQEIRRVVVSEKQQKALTAFGKAYAVKWRAKTDCRRGYVVTDCGNYKAPRRGSRR